MRNISTLLFFALMPFSVVANSAVIDFEVQTEGVVGPAIVEGDYRFDSAGDFRVATTSGTKAVVGPNPFNPFVSPVLTLRRVDAAAFNFLSLEVFASDSNGLGVPIGFTGRYADGSTIFYWAMTPSYGSGAPIPSTRTLLQLPDSFLNVVSVSWQNGALFHQFDNIMVEVAGSAVPEPSSWAMLIAGFGLSGAALRRRRSLALQSVG
jgi:hypothetical protein